MVLLIGLASLLVGMLGATLGIGGGVLIIPILTSLFGVPIKTAVGASIISIVATSSAAGAVYAGKGLSHTRLAVVLEIATTLGALVGGITAVLISPDTLTALFVASLVYVAYALGRVPSEGQSGAPTGLLDTCYIDPLTAREACYGVRHLPVGLGASFLAGNVSGLLGIGGGVIKVPIMTGVMGMPLRAAIATSNVMIGVTAASSAVIYYQHGLVDPAIAIPTALGVLIGAQLSTRIRGNVRSQRLKQVFQVLLIVFATQMLYQLVTG